MKILHLEDNPADAALVAALLADELPLCQITLVDTRPGFLAALERGGYDLVLSDFSLKGFDGLNALQLARQQAPAIPFLFLSGSIGEELAVETVRAGAYDYVLKDRIKRLPTAIRHAVDEARERHHRQLAEEAQVRLVEILENTTDFVGMTAPDGRMLYLNRAGLRLTGRPENTDVTQLTIRDFLPPESGASPLNLTVDEPGQADIQSDETTLFTRDGRRIPVSQVIIAHRSAESGKLEFYSTVMRDLSAQKASERLLREQSDLLNKARDAIIISTLDNRFAFWNLGAERIFGWTATEVLGHTDREVFPPEVCAQLALARHAVEQTGEWRGELQIAHKRGHPVVIELSLSNILNDTGQPQARLSICTDITEKKKLEEQFLRAQRLESIGLLAAGIAHDLNNVLAPMLLAVPMLRESVTAPDDRELLVSIEDSTRRGAALVRQILDFVRGVSGVARIIDITPLLRDLAGIVAGTFPKNIQLEESIPAGLPPVKANPTQIHQVLLNLAVNARDAMPAGGVIRLRAERRVFDELNAAAIPGARAGAYLAIEVEDTGTGIPAELLASIWEPFFTTKDAGKGTGLGLSTVRGIVESHGGFATVQTTLGRGSTFGVCLPEVNPAAGTGSNHTVINAPRGRGELILVVDDDTMIRDIATATLTRHGYRVLAARDGTEAVAIFAPRAREIRLVITDLNMPNLDGAALARVARRLHPSVKILAMSGLSSVGTDGAFPATAVIDAFLSKPFTLESLLNAVHEQLKAAR